MGKLLIDIKHHVIAEHNCEGNVVNVHILPNHTTHFLIGNECWCKPTINEKMADELKDIPGAKVYTHNYYCPRWDTTYGFRRR